MGTKEKKRMNTRKLYRGYGGIHLDWAERKGNGRRKSKNET